MESGYSYGINFLLAIDQLGNAILGGSCDETLSSRTYRMARLKGGGWATFEKVVNTLFWKDRGPAGQRHCELAYNVETQRGHMPKALAFGHID